MMNELSPTKKCCRCHQDKPIDHFHRMGAYPNGKIRRRGACNVCSAPELAKWRVNNPEKQFAAQLKRHHGLSIESYNRMLFEQDSSCAICGGPHNPEIKRGKLFVDHDHETGRIRGLLCIRCNTLIGHAHDSLAVLASAIEYLKRFGK